MAHSLLRHNSSKTLGFAVKILRCYNFARNNRKPFAVGGYFFVFLTFIIAIITDPKVNIIIIVSNVDTASPWLLGRAGALFAPTSLLRRKQNLTVPYTYVLQIIIQQILPKIHIIFSEHLVLTFIKIHLYYL